MNLLQPAAHLPLIADSAEVESKYRYWRLRVFYSMYIGYALYYFTRKSFTFVMPALINDLGFDKTGIGFLGSVMSIAYGVSKFTSGVLADRSNPRYFIAIGLMLTGVFNLFFGMSSTLFFFALFWGLNGWFQGWGWPPCARLLTHWYAQRERGTWWGVWNTSHNVGAAIIAVGAAYCAEHYGWRMAMYIPGVLCILAGLFLINRLRDTPQSLGLPCIEKFKGEAKVASSATASVDSGEERELSKREILWEYVLKNRYIWVLAAAYFFVYLVRMAINEWSLLYLIEEKGYRLDLAGGAVCWFEIGGFFGSLAAGWGSDKIFKGKRGPVNTLFAAAVVIAVASFWYVPAGAHFFLDGAMLFLIGFCIFGPQMLIGVAAAELSHKKAAATATGFTGFFAYAGAAAAGYPLGWVAKHFGWYGFFWTVGVCGVISALLLAPLWNVRHNARCAATAAK